MRYPVKLLAWLGLAALTAALPARAELTPHSAEYKVRISVLSGTLNTRLSATDGAYAAVHSIVPTGMARMVARGSIEEMSVFNLSERGMLPSHYRSSDTLSRDNTQADVSFDWSTGALHGTVNDAPINGNLDGIVHDRVSIQYELMRDMKNGGPRGTYTLFDIDELKTLNVTLIGSREIDVPAGRFTAIGVQHQAEGSSRVTTLWCAEALDYLPIVIEQHRKGKLRLRATLTEYVPETT
ncbi:MAG: DUF3108 domain-containing protein [Woeseiaceae bacterium]|nr:DUF3108 domain-containing protein [Woeseiaceae bacterium]